MNPYTPILILMIAATMTVGKAVAQLGFTDNVFYNRDKKVLDLCTPYALHIGVNITDENQTRTCASELGQLKWMCDSNTDPRGCADPRYTNWLVNDYGSYPIGTWDFALCKPQYTGDDCPGATYANMVRP